VRPNGESHPVQSTDKQQIVERLKKLQPSGARLWGRMTPPQMICHLADSRRVVVGEKTWKTERISVTLVPLPRWFVKWVARETPLPWPRGIKTRPEVDPELEGTPPTRFDADVAEWLQLLDRLARRPRDFEWQRASHVRHAGRP
jgi:hypothetical protein